MSSVHWKPSHGFLLSVTAKPIIPKVSSPAMMPADVLVLSDLDQLQPRVTGDELLVVLHVVGVRRSQAADGEDDEPHPCDTSRVSEQDRGQERHINIHFSPDEMAGHYANFANVS